MCAGGRTPRPPRPSTRCWPLTRTTWRRSVRLQMHAAQDRMGRHCALAQARAHRQAADPLRAVLHAQDAAQRGDSRPLTTHLQDRRTDRRQPEPLLRYRPADAAAHGLAHFGLGELWTPHKRAPSRSTATAVRRLGRGRNRRPSSATQSRSNGRRHCTPLEGNLRRPPTPRPLRPLGSAAKLQSPASLRQAATLIALRGSGRPGLRPEFQSRAKPASSGRVRMGQSG